jgi:hypothetical protein
MKTVICLQLYEADKATAMRLARFITDIEPVKRDDVELVFCARFDCDHDEETERYCADRFQVTRFNTSTPWTGWPAGPNGMAFDLLRWMLNRVKAGEVSRKDALILIEPDCVPVHANWINLLLEEWNQAHPHGVLMMGAWRPSGGEHGHLNGNCILKPSIFEVLSEGVFNEYLAWDCSIVPDIYQNWWPTHQIKNCFESRNATEQDMRGSVCHADGRFPVLVHGYKDDSAYNIARRLLLECVE